VGCLVTKFVFHVFHTNDTKITTAPEMNKIQLNLTGHSVLVWIYKIEIAIIIITIDTRAGARTGATHVTGIRKSISQVNKFCGQLSNVFNHT